VVFHLGEATGLEDSNHPEIVIAAVPTEFTQAELRTLRHELVERSLRMPTTTVLKGDPHPE
jgi:hypothetical protein